MNEPAQKTTTPASAPPRDSDVLELGRRIRALRMTRGLSLRQLGSAAGVSESFVSQIERGVASPSVQSLRRIAAALDVRLVSLLAGPDSSGQLVKAADRRRIADTRKGWVDEFLTPGSARHLQINMSVIDPGCGESEAYTHDSEEECVVVLDGTLVVETNGERHELETGDALLIDPRLPHAFFNPGPDQARVIWVMTPPSW